jgi:beta-galactosidase
MSAGYRFGAVDLQREPAAWPRVIALASGRHLDPAVQHHLAAHVEAGGGLLLYGPLPDRDLRARPCTVLADALGLTAGPLIRGSHRYYPSITARSWAGPRAETRVSWLQELRATSGSPVLLDVATGRPCGVEVGLGRGRTVVWSLGLTAEPALFRAAATRLGASPGLTHDTGAAGATGLVATTTGSDSGRLVHLLNVLAGLTCTTRLSLDGDPAVRRPGTHPAAAYGPDAPARAAPATGHDPLEHRGDHRRGGAVGVVRRTPGRGDSTPGDRPRREARDSHRPPPRATDPDHLLTPLT